MNHHNTNTTSSSSKHGYEVFIWGGPQRREGENEPVYAEGLGGVGVVQLAFTTPLLDGLASTSTASSTSNTAASDQPSAHDTTTAATMGASTTNSQLLQQDHHHKNSNNHNPGVTDPRKRAVAFCLTKDCQVYEWGPAPHWSQVPHQGRRKASVSTTPTAAAAAAAVAHASTMTNTTTTTTSSVAPSPSIVPPHRMGFIPTTTTTAALPLTASSSASSFSVLQLATGLDHYAAVTASGHLYTWGSCAHGKLGTTLPSLTSQGGSTVRHRRAVMDPANDVPRPHVVPLPHPIVQVACGDAHTLALTNQGQVYSWGKRELAGHDNGANYNSLNNNLHHHGQPQQHDQQQQQDVNHNLGGDDMDFASTHGSNHHSLLDHELQLQPRLLQGALEGKVVIQIAARAKHSAAITAPTTNTTSGSGNGDTNSTTNTRSGSLLYTWGKDNHGQLGHGNKRPCLVPTLVQSLVDENDTGDDDTNDHGTNTNNAEPTNIVQVSCGTYHMAVLNDQGHVYTFGNNKGGQLGTGDKEEQCTPTKVAFFLGSSVEPSAATTGTSTGRPSLQQQQQQGSSSSSSFVFRGRRRANNNRSKSLANLYSHATTTNTRTGKALSRKESSSSGAQFITQVACGKYHTAVLTQKGDVFTWGYGYNGQLGHGSYLENLIPRKVEKLKGYHVEGIGADGLYTWALVSPSSLAADDVSFTSSLRSMVNNEEFADVEFELLADDDDDDGNEFVDEGDNDQDGVGRRRHGGRVERVYAHRAILIQRSHLFRAMFRSGMRESTERVISISSDIRKPIFLLLLEYIYTNTVVTVPVEAAFELWEVAEMHGLKKLQSLCCASVERNISVDNAALLLQMAAAAAATTSSASAPSTRRRDHRHVPNGTDPHQPSEGDLDHLEDTDDHHGGLLEDDDEEEENDHDDPKNRLKEICMDFVVHNFASVSRTNGLQQITNVELCHEIMMEVANSYCA